MTVRTLRNAKLTHWQVASYTEHGHMLAHMHTHTHTTHTTHTHTHTHTHARAPPTHTHTPAESGLAEAIVRIYNETIKGEM